MARLDYPSHNRPSLVPHQIVYLEQDSLRLYGEVIQVVESRQRCWVRPMACVAGTAVGGLTDAYGRHVYEHLYDLRLGPDVIWPLSLFQPALDEDWLAILPYLTEGEELCKLCDCTEANHLLSQILRQVVAYPALGETLSSTDRKVTPRPSPSTKDTGEKIEP